MINLLRKCPFFSSISDTDLEQFYKNYKTKFKTYEKSNVIAFNKERCNKLIILLDGSVRGEMQDYSGKTIIVETIKAPKPLAPAFIFGKNNFFPVDIVVLKDSVCIEIPKDDLMNLFTDHPTILKYYLDLISNKSYFLSERMHFLSFKTIKEKFASYILEKSKDNESYVILNKPQSELAAFFAVARPSLARVIGDMVSDGIISVNKKRVDILNLERLKNILYN